MVSIMHLLFYSIRGDGARVDLRDDAVALGLDADLRVHGALLLDAGGDDRGCL